MWNDVESSVELSNSAFCFTKSICEDIMEYVKLLILKPKQKFRYTEFGPSILHKVLINNHQIFLYSQNHPEKYEFKEIAQGYELFGHKMIHLTGFIRTKAGYKSYIHLATDMLKALSVSDLFDVKPSNSSIDEEVYFDAKMNNKAQFPFPTVVWNPLADYFKSKLAQFVAIVESSKGNKSVAVKGIALHERICYERQLHGAPPHPHGEGIINDGGIRSRTSISHPTDPCHLHTHQPSNRTFTQPRPSYVSAFHYYLLRTTLASFYLQQMASDMAKGDETQRQEIEKKARVMIAWLESLDVAGIERFYSEVDDWLASTDPHTGADEFDSYSERAAYRDTGPSPSSSSSSESSHADALDVKERQHSDEGGDLSVRRTNGKRTRKARRGEGKRVEGEGEEKKERRRSGGVQPSTTKRRKRKVVARSKEDEL